MTAPKYLYLQDELIQACKLLKEKRIVHVGARLGEEDTLYTDYLGAKDVTWIEANPALVWALRHRLEPQGHKVIIALIADTDGKKVTFNVSNNDFHSSSMLPLKDHKTIHPEVYYTHSFEHTTTTLDSLKLNPNILVADIQGCEGLMIKGAQKTLKGVSVLYMEVNFMEMYEGCHLIDDLDKMLPDFRRTHTYKATRGWGDAIWIRSS